MGNLFTSSQDPFKNAENLIHKPKVETSDWKPVTGSCQQREPQFEYEDNV